MLLTPNGFSHVSPVIRYTFLDVVAENFITTRHCSLMYDDESLSQRIRKPTEIFSLVERRFRDIRTSFWKYSDPRMLCLIHESGFNGRTERIYAPPSRFPEEHYLDCFSESCFTLYPRIWIRIYQQVFLRLYSLPIILVQFFELLSISLRKMLLGDLSMSK